MKRAIIFLYLIFICIYSTAQTPEFINYQAIVRDGGEVVSGQTVYYRFGIIKGELPGESVYTEKHTTTTNQFGLVTLAIGNGTDKTVDFSSIEWGEDIYFLKVEIDMEGDEVYTDMGTTRMLSVPYALHAKTAAAADETDPEVGVNTTDFLSKWDGTSLIKSSVIDNGKIGIGTNNPSALLDLNIPADFPSPGFSINMPDYSDQSINHNAFTISSAWDAEGIARTNIFTLEDEESSPVLTLRRLGYNHVTVITPAALYFSGENGNNIYLNWEEGFSYGTTTSGYNIQINTEFPLYYRTYSGTWNDMVKFTNQGNAYFAGNLQVGGNISGEFEIDSLHVSKITGLLGDGYSLRFPDILDNMGILEVNGIGSNHVVVLNGPGYDVEAIEKYNEWGERDDLPGRSMENPIIFEADNTNQTWLTDMESWFNESDPAPKDLAVIIPDVGGVESIRWNCTSFIPGGYEPGVDNRTRFTLINSQLPDIILEINLQEPDPFGSECSMNLENDPDDIYFDGQKYGCPSLEVDTAGQVMTLTWDFEEASGIWTYFSQYFQGYDTKFQVIASWLIGLGVKHSTFDGCFPLHFQHLTGFGLDKKAVLQVKIWYVRMREA